MSPYSNGNTAYIIIPITTVSFNSPRIDLGPIYSYVEICRKPWSPFQSEAEKDPRRVAINAMMSQVHLVLSEPARPQWKPPSFRRSRAVLARLRLR